ncbi:hypothetical protein N7492_009853 [Penicillium capsulatum]|uniref:Phosphatidic acid phosphatase type 2/haloperoxidase domain-containing protein n=1 Tax=Penicillium capsulatum TaxID=69766 RepID=A0A9W9HMR1_9EURO|nr:hypothetical protein N7492_009853 [Penicillium capsulatum]
MISLFTRGLALIGYGFSRVTPSQHLFSLTDLDISYPYIKDETVSTETLVLTGLFAPAVIIMIGALLLVPGSAGSDGARPSKSQILRRRIWEWNAGWMGLAVAVAGVWMSTQGLKDLVGRPRPDLLSRCNPDLSTVSAHALSGLGGHLRDAPTLVSWKICQDQSSRVFSIGFPYLPHFPVEGEAPTDDRSSPRNRGAAPPVLMMIIAFVPTATAFFIAASRWANYRHHTFDILFGSAMGITFAWVGFRMYHLPIRRGAGWAWGPRGRQRAFLRGIGFPSSLGTDSWSYTRDTRRGPGDADIEDIPMQASAAERV